MTYDPKKNPMMITDLDETLLRDGIALAVAEEMDRFIRNLSEMRADLRNAYIVERPKWDALFAEFAAFQEKVGPAMEYAKCYMDQWPGTDDESE